MWCFDTTFSIFLNAEYYTVQGAYKTHYLLIVENVGWFTILAIMNGVAVKWGEEMGRGLIDGMAAYTQYCSHVVLYTGNLLKEHIWGWKLSNNKQKWWVG